MTQQQLPPFQCTKCAGTECNVHLRHVQIAIGWALSKVETVAPCVICRTCGDITVGTNTTIGRYIGPLPPDPQPPRGGNVVDLPRPALSGPVPAASEPEEAGGVVGSADDR